MSKFVSLSSAAKLVHTIGATNTVIIEGQPGVGKSATLDGFPTDQYVHAYIECNGLQVGDLAIPYVCKDKDVFETKWALDSRFRISEALDCGKPIAVMVDELGKASKAVINTLTRLLHERILCGTPLPEGSVVFATTNLRTDGVGDMIPAHVYNRCVTVQTYGPRVAEWQGWAMGKGINPILIAWANENPQAFDTYAHPLTGTDAKDNLFNFNPTRPGQDKQFCSPRSLANASPILDNREALGAELTYAALAGTVGGPAAMSLTTFIEFADALPKFSDVVGNPDMCRLPSGVAAYVSAALMAARIDEKNCAAVLQYVKRWESDEAKSMFCSLAGRKPGAINFLRTQRDYVDITARTMSLVVNG